MSLKWDIAKASVVEYILEEESIDEKEFKESELEPEVLIIEESSLYNCLDAMVDDDVLSRERDHPNIYCLEDLEAYEDMRENVSLGGSRLEY